MELRSCLGESIDLKLAVLLVFFFLYRFVNVGFNAVVVYHAYVIVDCVWGSAFTVAVLTLGSIIGLVATGLYVLYRVKPQVPLLMLMVVRGILLLLLVLFSPVASRLTLLLPVLLTYSAALWIERSVLGGIAIENVPSIARGLNAINLASGLGGLTVSALLTILLRSQVIALTTLLLLHVTLTVLISTLLLAGKLGFRVTVPEKGTLKVIFSETTVMLYTIMFILNIPVSVLLSIAPSFGAQIYTLFYMTSEAMAIIGRMIFIILGDRIVLAARVLLYGALLGYVLMLIAYMCSAPTALITSIIAINIAIAAGTVYIGNVLKRILTGVIYNVSTVLNASSLLGALYGTLTLLTPTPNTILTTTLIATILAASILHRKIGRVSESVTSKS